MKTRKAIVALWCGSVSRLSAINEVIQCLYTIKAICVDANNKNRDI